MVFQLTCLIFFIQQIPRPSEDGATDPSRRGSPRLSSEAQWWFPPWHFLPSNPAVQRLPLWCRFVHAPDHGLLPLLTATGSQRETFACSANGSPSFRCLWVFSVRSHWDRFAELGHSASRSAAGDCTTTMHWRAAQTVRVQPDCAPRPLKRALLARAESGLGKVVPADWQVKTGAHA